MTRRLAEWFGRRVLKRLGRWLTRAGHALELWAWRPKPGETYRYTVTYVNADGATSEPFETPPASPPVVARRIYRWRDLPPGTKV